MKLQFSVHGKGLPFIASPFPCKYFSSFEKFLGLLPGLLIYIIFESVDIFLKTYRAPQAKILGYVLNYIQFCIHFRTDLNAEIVSGKFGNPKFSPAALCEHEDKSHFQTE